MSAPAARSCPPLVITVAPTGAYRSKADHPNLPVTAAEVARAAAACRDAGAAMIHVHVRDRDGRHLLDADAYAETTRAIRDAVGDGLIVQASTESGGRYRPEAQMAVVRALQPEAVSLALAEIIPDPDHEKAGAAFLRGLHDRRTLVQYIVYSARDLARFRAYCRRGLVPGVRHFLLFVLGRHVLGQVSTPRDILPFLAVHDDAQDWAVCAFGPRENACALTAAALGGHSRVGFENNLYRFDGRYANENADLVAQLRDGAAFLGRAVADADQARDLLCGNFSSEKLYVAGGRGG